MEKSRLMFLMRGPLLIYKITWRKVASCFSRVDRCAFIKSHGEKPPHGFSRVDRCVRNHSFHYFWYVVEQRLTLKSGIHSATERGWDLEQRASGTPMADTRR